MKLVTASQLAEMMALKPGTVASWSRTTDMPRAHCGGALRYDPEAVRAWLEAGGPRQRRDPTADAEPSHRGYPLGSPCECGAASGLVIDGRRGTRVLRCEGCRRWVRNVRGSDIDAWLAAGKVSQVQSLRQGIAGIRRLGSRSR